MSPDIGALALKNENFATLGWVVDAGYLAVPLAS
jgi:hypothetical protein